MKQLGPRIAVYVRQRDQFLDAQPTLRKLREAAQDDSLGDIRIGAGLRACFPGSKVGVRRACRSLGIDEFRLIRGIAAQEWQVIEEHFG